MGWEDRRLRCLKVLPCLPTPTPMLSEVFKCRDGSHTVPGGLYNLYILLPCHGLSSSRASKKAERGCIIASTSTESRTQSFYSSWAICQCAGSWDYAGTSWTWMCYSLHEVVRLKSYKCLTKPKDLWLPQPKRLWFSSGTRSSCLLCWL